MSKKYWAILFAVLLLIATLALTSAIFKRDVYDYYGSPIGYAREKVNYSLFDAENYTGVRANFSGNVTASWFLGYINWSNIVSKFITAVDNIYIYMVGTTATFNETKLNISIDARSNILNVNSSDFWDGLNVPSDLNNLITLSQANITDEDWIEDSQEGDLNVNQSDWWITYNAASDLNNLIIINAANISAGTIDWARMPTLYEANISDLQAYLLNGTSARFTELNVTGDIYSNNYQVISYQRTVDTKNVTMTAVI